VLVGGVRLRASSCPARVCRRRGCFLCRCVLCACDLLIVSHERICSCYKWCTIECPSSEVRPTPVHPLAQVAAIVPGGAGGGDVSTRIDMGFASLFL